MDSVNVGLIGTGFMGMAHSVAYATMPMFFWPPPVIPRRLVIAGTSVQSSRDAAARFGFERSTPDWRQVVDDPSVDVIDICTPNDTHAEIAVAAAGAGKHIMCEKPLSRTVTEARQMCDAVDAGGVVNMVAFNYRRTPAVALAKKMLDEGAIGDCLNFRGIYLQDWSADPEVPHGWRFSKQISGSGALGDIASHVLDTARFLVGDVAEVNGLLETYVHERPVSGKTAQKAEQRQGRRSSPRVSVDVDDEVLSLLRFENGAVGTLEVSRNAYGRHNHLAFELHGSKGSLSFNYERLNELRLYSTSDPPDRRGFRTIYTGPPHPYGDALWPIPAIGVGYSDIKVIECYEFLRSVAGQTPSSPSFYDGLQVAYILEAIEASSKLDGWVDVRRSPGHAHNE